MGGVPVDGDFGGEVDPDFVDFLKNREGDLFGGGGYGGEGEERVEESVGRASVRGVN